MSVVLYAEQNEGSFKKTTLELASYAHKLAEQLATNVVAITINANNVIELANYGVSKVVNITNDSLKNFNAKAYASALAEAAHKENAEVLVTASTTDSNYLAPLLAVAMQAGFVANVIALPLSTTPFRVKRNVFSNKAFATAEITSKIKMLSISKNSFGIHQKITEMSTENFDSNVDGANSGIVIEGSEKVSGKVTIADAEVVVSGGRGLKGPENWHLIENLAEVLGGATACSKPVSDLGWRPHSEHVGQTGKPVASNLYIAVGISGAIQHIAGVNASKTKVVINSDPEAPFFKAADYGVVGDAFEIVPQLIEKLKQFKAAN